MSTNGFSEAVVWWCFVKKVCLKTLQNSQENIWWILFFNKVAVCRAAISFRMRLWYRYFPMNFAKNFKNTNFVEQMLIMASFGSHFRYEALSFLLGVLKLSIWSVCCWMTNKILPAAHLTVTKRSHVVPTPTIYGGNLFFIMIRNLPRKVIFSWSPRNFELSKITYKYFSSF